MSTHVTVERKVEPDPEDRMKPEVPPLWRTARSLIVRIMKSSIFWDIKQCSSLKRQQIFRRNILSSGLKNKPGKKQE
jgi:hypothetical protein